MDSLASIRSPKRRKLENVKTIICFKIVEKWGDLENYENVENLRTSRDTGEWHLIDTKGTKEDATWNLN